MKISASPTKPDEIEISIVMTATLDEWRQLRDQLDNNYPSWKLANEIGFVITAMQKSFSPEPKQKPTDTCEP